MSFVTFITFGVYKAYPNQTTWPNPHLTLKHYRKVPLAPNTWKLGELQKKFTQNLTRCKIFNSKSDACSKCWFKFWHVVNFSIQNLTRWKIVVQKFVLENYVFRQGRAFWKSTKNAMFVQFAGLNLSKHVFFESTLFFKIWFFGKKLTTKSDAL